MSGNRWLSSGHEREELVLALGFVAFAVGVFAAYDRPATGYEVSIYGGTPVAFWAGIAVALAIALVLALARSGRARGLALVLGGLAVSAVVFLPLLRGYRFYGSADALTHLGWTKDMAAGSLSSLGLFYPGIHTVASFLHLGTGLAPTQALMLSTLVFAVAFVVFVPLTVRAITHSDEAAAIAALSAFMFMPVNNVTTQMQAHPFTQTLLFTPVFLFLLVVYLTPGEQRRGWFPATPVGLLLVTVAFGIVLYHPQQAVNLVLLLWTISALQFVARRWQVLPAIARHRTVYVQTLLFTALTAAWIWREPRFRTSFGNVFAGVFGFLTGSTTPAEQVGSQGASLLAIGVGLPEMFAKLFLVSAVYLVLASLVAGGSLSDRFARLRPDAPAARTIVTYLAVGIAILLLVFVVYLLGSIDRQYFRHLGAVMVLVTVLGALSLYYLPRGGSTFASLRGRRAWLALFFAVMLPLGLMTVYQSPYIYKESQHVTEMQLEGFGTAFDYHRTGVPLVGIRGGVFRYSDGIQGFAASHPYEESVTSDELERLPAAVDGPTNLVVTTYSRQREVDAYRELRYTAAALDSIDGQRDVDRVESNGEVTLYYVRGG